MMVQVNESQSVGRRLVSRLLTGFTPDRKFQPGSLVSPLTASFNPAHWFHPCSQGSPLLTGFTPARDFHFTRCLFKPKTARTFDFTTCLSGEL
jgi:hypothetical protein